jgi:hypothetical protein
VEAIKKVLNPFGKTRNNESYPNMPLIELYKCNTQENDNKQDKAFNLDDSWYGFLKGKTGYDIKENRQGHEQQESKANVIGYATCRSDESF